MPSTHMYSTLMAPLSRPGREDGVGQTTTFERRRLDIKCTVVLRSRYARSRYIHPTTCPGSRSLRRGRGGGTNLCAHLPNLDGVSMEQKGGRRKDPPHPTPGAEEDLSSSRQKSGRRRRIDCEPEGRGRERKDSKANCECVHPITHIQSLSI